jgi:hypothetical protein
MSEHLMDVHFEAPCLNCQDRHIGCHGKCEKYLKYAAKERKAKYLKYQKETQWESREE